MNQLLLKLTEGQELTHKEMKEVTHRLLAQDTTSSEIAAVLTALRVRGESVSEITAIVEVLREKAMPVQTNLPDIMDNCGTGGDGVHSFNISTISAFVLAGAGIKVAKHGNRSVSSQTGSADVLEELGIALDFDGLEVEQLLQSNGIAFLFAPHVHQQLKPIMQVRKTLGVPTIFNLIGPLTNPVSLRTQFLGVYRRDMIEQMASVLHELGRERAVVVNGAGYMDEASLAGDNHLVLLNKGVQERFTIHPHDVGLNTYPNEAIKGGNAKDNAAILLDVLSGKESPFFETVLFNAGIGIFANGKAETVQQGVHLARKSIKSGNAYQCFENLVEYSKERKRKGAIG
ncbi:anthranilate phosphoribosyltransferase [Halalkalibacillus halophilus]|uniref:anthranilate phosphoribosyltransferase n=1 Tax=Halalkalibacillus halophilus TaxID=392827 RepID=UPI0004103F12|nr:anthranilate phosphoribosyltransferase [Halalkalibacillus halophilus]